MRQIEVINQETIIDVTAETSSVEILVRDYDSELVERFALEAQEAAIEAEESADIATAQASIATAQATIATTQAGIATTQAGIATTQSQIATTKANEASASAASALASEQAADADRIAAQAAASTATTQAGIATTQAGIATTKAGEASDSAAASLASETDAETAASTATTQAGIATTKAQEAAASAQEAQDIVDSITPADLTEATSSVLTITGGTDAVLGSGTTIQVKQAGSSQSGFLSSTDWTTFNSKQNAITNPVTGTGTSGQVAFWNGTSSQTGDNELFWDNTNKRLGIGTNSPLVKLDIGTGGVLRASSGGGNFVDLGYNTSTGPEINTQGFNLFRFKFSGTETFQVSNNGPRLIGDFNLNGVSNLAYLQLYSGSSGVVRLANLSSNVNFGRLFLTTNSIDRFGIFTNGNILIQNGGTFTDAGFRLDVNGTARVQGGLTVGTQTASAFVHIAAQGSLITDNVFRIRNSANTFDIMKALGDGTVSIGIGAGNVNSGSNNIFFGGNAGRDTTIGNNNVFIGFQAGRFNTTGTVNVFVGQEAGFNSLTTTGNSFFGNASGRNNTTGNENSGFGFNAGRENTTGTQNAFFGVAAGRFIADGATANTITNNSVFLGSQSRANADNQTNQIVIGHTAIGLGSNTTVIGNTSTTFGRWFGNLLVGTSTNAGFALDVNGTARVQGNLTLGDGTTVSNKDIILVSNRFARLQDSGFNLTNWFGNTVNFKHIFGFNANSLFEMRQDSSFHIGLTGINQFSLSLRTTATENQLEAYRTAFNADVKPLRLFTSDPFATASQTLSSGDIFIQTGTGVNGGNTGRIVFQIGSSANNTAQFSRAGNLLLKTTTDAASSILTMESTTQGFLPPRMTTTQKNAIASPATGLVVYDNTLNKLSVFTGLVWETVTSL
jgi:hypothetical protein